MEKERAQVREDNIRELNQAREDALRRDARDREDVLQEKLREYAVQAAVADATKKHAEEKARLQAKHNEENSALAEDAGYWKGRATAAEKALSTVRKFFPVSPRA